MTKRLEIAAQVLQGILANPHNRDSFTDNQCPGSGKHRNAGERFVRDAFR